MRNFPIDILPCMRLISSFVISVADYLSFSFSAKNILFQQIRKKYFEIFLTLTSGEDIVIPKLIGSNSESSLSKPSIGLVCYKCKLMCVLRSYIFSSMRNSVQWTIGKTDHTVKGRQKSKKYKPKPNFNDFLHTDKQVLLPRHFDIIQKFPLYIGHIFLSSTRSESVHSSSS